MEWWIVKQRRVDKVAVVVVVVVKSEWVGHLFCFGVQLLSWICLDGQADGRTLALITWTERKRRNTALTKSSS